jgi:glutamate synthase (NADPH/NADH) small chain
MLYDARTSGERMTQLPAERSESVFTDFKPAYTVNQAKVEANRCLYCHDAPCITACPTGIDIPEFIRKIATDNVRGSARTIFDSNVLGMSCARVCPVEVLCVGDCVYNEMGVPPIQIGKLQRYATDAAFAAGWDFYEAGEATGRSIGIVGGGPAALACAHRLRRFGHAVTIYDKRPRLGGLNTTGVAPYKMPADRSLEEVERVLAIGGIEVQLGVEIGQDLSFAELEARHDAVFLAFGLGPDSRLKASGNELAGVEGAVDFIERFKLGTEDLLGVEQAVVVGGGNTALDVVRELRVLGVPSVIMAYRGTEARMSGYAHEWAAAKVEGVSAAWQTQPIGFVGENGGVTGLRCIKLDDNKQPIAGSEHVIPAQRVYLAIGQSKLGALVSGLEGVEVEWGRVVVGEGQATGRPGVYAGGDCANGGKEVVNAVAEGRDAAVAIHAWLSESAEQKGAARA